MRRQISSDRSRLASSSLASQSSCVSARQIFFRVYFYRIRKKKTEKVREGVAMERSHRTENVVVVPPLPSRCENICLLSLFILFFFSLVYMLNMDMTVAPIYSGCGS
jgi:hypothetical protein